MNVTCHMFVQNASMSDNSHDCDVMLHESLGVVDIPNIKLLKKNAKKFQKKSPGGQCQFLCFFGSQCPKIMISSKALKAKLSSIPRSRKSVDAQPRMENRQAFV